MAEAEASVEGLDFLDAADRAILRFVVRLSLAPRLVVQADLQRLAAATGLDDAGLLDVVQVAACFAYMNRLADGTGVALSEKHRAVAEALFDAETIAAHLAWADEDAVAP